MKIRYVTESHYAGDEKRTADVASQQAIDSTDARVDDLARLLTRVDKRLKALEKQMASVEKSLADADKRLRDDCREIFSEVVAESMSPVFSAIRQHVSAYECTTKIQAIQVKRSNGKRVRA